LSLEAALPTLLVPLKSAFAQSYVNPVDAPMPRSSPNLTTISRPDYAAEAKKTVREIVANAINHAKDLANRNKFDQAAAEVEKAEAIPNKTPYEVFVVSSMATFVYVELKDYESAAKAIEAGINSGEMPPDVVQSRTNDLALMYYQTKDYAKAIAWGQKYVDQTKDPETEVLVGQAYYIQKDYKNASDAMNQAIKMAEAKGLVPKEGWLDVLMSSDLARQDNDALQADLELLVWRYPQPKYWKDLLNLAQRKFKDNTRNALDVYRLMFAAGAMNSADEYAEMARMALRAGYPGEAKALLQKGVDAGTVSRTVKDYGDLIAKADHEAEIDTQGFAKGAQQAAVQLTGEAAVKFGEAYWGYGQYDKAIDMIELGLKKGVKNKDDAALRLEISAFYAGDKAGALQAFQAITPGTPAAELGQLWMLLKGNSQTATVQ
jgi:tetratricopeptide (TPR) repeat protein